MNEPQPSPDPTPDKSHDVNPQTEKVVEKVDADQLQHFVSTIKTAEHQVGENIIHALRHDATVAVLTTIVTGPDGQQRIISAALNPRMMSEVQEVLRQAKEEREPEEPCVGFHCLVKPRSDASDAPAADAEPS